MTGPDGRIAVWVTGTALGLALLFLYPTSLGAVLLKRHRAAVAPAGLVAAPAAPQPVAPTAGTRAAAAAPPARRKQVPATPRAGAPSPLATSAVAAAPVQHAPAAPAPQRSTPAPRRTTAPPQPTRRTINGAAVDTRYGPVQVQITLSGTRIVSSDAIVYPQESGRDQEINSRAIPQLNHETVQAQSANIDTVSGATYTSDGYRQSLQSALDAAHQ